MSLSIWKYPLSRDGWHGSVPVGARFLSAQVQHSDIVVWALVDTTAPVETRKFRILGTGFPLEGEPGEYVGTVQTHNGHFVWHIFVEMTA
jgi:hypothetical protein